MLLSTTKMVSIFKNCVIIWFDNAYVRIMVIQWIIFFYLAMWLENWACYPLADASYCDRSVFLLETET